MGKNFTEFWKRPTAAFLALVMLLSALCSAGVPVQSAHAEEVITPQEVDGRIISESIMQKIADGKTWASSSEMLTEVFTEIFGTTVAKMNDIEGVTEDVYVDLAMDINNFTPEAEAMLAILDEQIGIRRAVPITLSGNGKYMTYYVLAQHLPNLPDDPLQNLAPVEWNSRWYSNLAASYMDTEGALINREGAISVGLGKFESVAELRDRYKTTAEIEFVTPIATATYLGKTFNYTVERTNAPISNVPYLNTADFSDFDATPTIMMVPRGAISFPKEVIVRDVTNTTEPKEIDGVLIDYVTASGEAYTAGTPTTEKVTATVHLPAGYRWVDNNEDGQREFGYWDTVAYVDVVEVNHSVTLNVVDKFSAVTQLPQAELRLEHLVGVDWEDCGVLVNWELSPAQIRLIKDAAKTDDFKFRIINSAPHQGYDVDPAEVQIDARFETNKSHQYQEVARYKIIITNIADDGVPMYGARYAVKYGTTVDTVLTLGPDGTVTTGVFSADGATAFSIQQLSSIDGYVAGDMSEQFPTVPAQYDPVDNCLVYMITDEDAKYIPPDYNHYVNISVIDDVSQPVKDIVLGLYTDPDCRIPARAEDDSEITAEMRKSDTSGKIALPEVPAGLYYIRLESSTTGYTDTLFNPDTFVNTEIFTINVADDDEPVELTVGIKRQRGEINLTVTDDKNVPVSGVVYELKTLDINPSEYSGATLNNGIVVGRYTTDENGAIHITHMTEGPFAGNALINGEYSLDFVSAPEGYEPAEGGHFLPNLHWVEGLDVVVDDFEDCVPVYKTYTMNVLIEDEHVATDALHGRYSAEDDDVFKNAYNNSLLPHVAYLTKGQDITMIVENAEPIEVMIDGAMVTIPADTVLLTHEVNGALSMSFTSFEYQPVGADAPIQIGIPVGVYRVSMTDSGIGYTWVVPESDIYAFDDVNMTIDIVLQERIISSQVDVDKTDANYGTPIKDISFVLVNVDVLSAHGLDVTEPNALTNRDVCQFMTDNDIAPRYVATTGIDGKAGFGYVPYGTYWLIEVYDQYSSKYAMSHPEVVTVDGTPVAEDITNTSKASYIRLINTDKDTDAPIKDAQFTVTLDSAYQETLLTNLEGKALSTYDYMNGDITIDNLVAGDGYVVADSINISVVDGDWFMITEAGPEPLARYWDTAAQKWCVDIPVMSERNKLTVKTLHDGVLLPGTEVIVYDSAYNVVTTLDCADGTAEYRGLKTGVYYLTQTPIDGFITLPEQALTVDKATEEYVVTFDNTKTFVTVKTYDAIGGWELNGVTVEMYQDDELIATFDDEHKSHKGIPVGDYTLKVVGMPFGYQAPGEDIAVTVLDIAAEQIFITNAINEDETLDEGVIVYEDNRTYGIFNIYKQDTVSETGLADVEFSLRYAEDVVIDGVAILANTEIAVLKTDANGNVTLADALPIAVYTANGVTPIKYALVETKLPVGQYVAGTASLNEELFDLNAIVFEYKDANTPVVDLGKIIVNNDRPEIVVTATSDPATRMFDENGSVDGFDAVTVLTPGQKITYTIEVTNVGTATGYDIDIRDILPAEFKVTNVSTGTFTQGEDGKIYWHINELKPGMPQQLILEAVVESDSATMVQNQVEWYMPATPYAPGEGIDKEDESLEWNKLPTFEYQIIIFQGMQNERELIVSAYDTIKFTYTFKSVAELDTLRITGEIPEGLSLVEGSPAVNGVPTENIEYKDGVLTFFAPEEWDDTMSFSYIVSVDHINNGEEHEWTSAASANFLANPYKDETMTLMTDVTTILADALMTVEYDTDILTYMGAPDDYENLSTLQASDSVRHTFRIYNDGISTLKRIMVQDILPDNVTLAPVENENIFIATKGQEVVWYIVKLAPGEYIELHVDTTVKEQKAGLLVNSAKYDLMDSVPVINDDQTITFPAYKSTARTTDSSVYQVLEFHKTAEVAGKNITDGKVAIGDTLVYTMSVTAEDLVDGIVVTDKLPAGVTLLPGSIQYKLAGDEAWSNVADAAAYDAASRTVTFYTDAQSAELLTAKKGVNYFRFSVTVDRIGSNNANANSYNKAEFTNTAHLEYWAIPGDIDSVATLNSESVSHMTEISLTGNKSGSVATYEGVYADRKNVTVVANGNELRFDIAIKNTGANSLTDVVVQDTIPENSKLLAKDGDTFTQKDGVLTWIIPEIKPEETATVSFTVEVAAPADKAVEIINQAKYAVPADINNIKDSEWVLTDSVVYQVISIVMSSSVPGGVDETDAKSVEIGSTITYTITVECVDDIYGLNLSNKIPDGMEYVQDSAKVKIGDGAAEAAKITLDGSVIKFTPFDEVKAGKLIVSFDVKVKDTAEYDKDFLFVNQAEATLKPNKDVDTTMTIKTNPISHTTKKTNATDTPKLGLETTSASLVWGLITMVALAGIGVFGYFGFIEPNKKRRK